MDEAATPQPSSAPRVEYLRVRNFRALRDLELRDLTPLTAFIGPNGSGKSTIFDVFAFLHEAFTTSLKAAVESRFGMRELRTRGEEGPIEISLEYRMGTDAQRFSYYVAFDQVGDRLAVESETLLDLGRESDTATATLLDKREGIYYFDPGLGQRIYKFEEADAIGAAVFSYIGVHPETTVLRRFISNWYVSDIDATDVRRIPEAGPQQRLSRTGDNVANVLEWVAERHPERLETIEAQLRKRVPHLESLSPIATGDGRSMLQLKDAPFERGIPARYASEGTLSLLAHLTALYGQEPPTLMGFEEPETNLPPQLLYGLTEGFRIAAARSQVFVNTHSPFILDALRADEVRILYRDERGFTQSTRASDIRGVPESIEAGAVLGDLWTQGFFGVGNPLGNGGASTRPGGP